MTKAEERAALQARKKGLDEEITVLKAKVAQAKEAGLAHEEDSASLKAKEEEALGIETSLRLEATQERNAALEEALVAQREKDADAAVQAAVKRGAIPVKDEALQATWKTKITIDPEMAELLAKLPGSRAMQLPRLTFNRVEVVREDSTAVLNAFAEQRDPRRRASLYASEIRKRLGEGDPLDLAPLRANNNLGTLVGTLVSQRTLELLKLTFPVLTSITTDFSDQNARLGQTIDSRIITVPAVQDYDPVNGWPDSDAVTTDVPVTLNRQKGVPLTFTADVLSGTVRRLFDEFGPAQAYALGKDLVDALYALFTKANYTQAPIVAPAIDFGRPTLIDVGVALDAQGVPDGPMNRFCLLNGAYFGTLKKDQAIITLAAFQEKGIIEQGVLPDVEGFRTIKAVNLNPGGNVVGFGGSKSSAVIATRLDADYTSILPGASYGNVTTVTDPDIGLSVLQVQYVNHQKATATQRISLISGVSKGQIKAGQVITSQ